MENDDEMKHDDKAQRLPSLWILFKIVHYIKNLILFYIVFTVLGLDSTFMRVLGLGILMILVANILFVAFDWLHFRYYFSAKEMHIQEGRFFVKQRTIPLESIQSFHQNTPIFHRIFGFTSLILNIGATGDKATIKLEMLRHEESQRIQKHLRNIKPHSKNLTKEILEENEQVSDTSLRESSDAKIHFKMTKKEIFIFSLTSLEFMILIPIFYSLFSNLDAVLPLDTFVHSTFSFFNENVVRLILGIVALMGILLIIGYLSTYIQYRNFEVSSNQNRVFIQKGIINHMEFSLRKENIHSIEINTGIIHRLLGLVKVKMISLGTNNTENVEMKTDILFPFIKKEKALQLTPEILPGVHIDMEMEHLPRRSIFLKLLRPSYWWIISTIVIYLFWPNYLYVSFILLALTIISRFLEAFYSGYKINGLQTQLQKGGLNTKLYTANRSKIEELKITDSWIQRKLDLASVKVAIQSKPMKILTIKDIPRKAAVDYYYWYQK